MGGNKFPSRTLFNAVAYIFLGGSREEYFYVLLICLIGVVVVAIFTVQVIDCYTILAHFSQGLPPRKKCLERPGERNRNETVQTKSNDPI